MKLTKKEIQDEIGLKGFSCYNLDEYKNLKTPLNIECKNGHKQIASLETIRHENFSCPFCIGENSVSELLNTIEVPIKSGERIVAIDNATKNVGVSVFDNGKLVYYHLFSITGETLTRMVKNRKILEDIIITNWKPDLIVLEDIQLQNQDFNTFKTLAMLLGSTSVSIREYNIKIETILSSVWRNHFAIKGKDRKSQKEAAIKLVKDMYKINVNDDVAEAILLGKYSVDMIEKSKLKKLF